MKDKILTIASALFLVLVLDAAFVSCRGENELPIDDTQHPIAFASVAADQEAVTRATTLGKDFTVYGYKTVNDASQQVFNGYAVTYKSGSANTSESNTHNYEYVNGTSQPIKYWDFGASEYNFWGATGGTFTNGGTELTISGLTLTTTEPTGSALYSQLYHRSPVSTDVVQLQFKYTYAKLRVLFYTTGELTGDDQILLSDITFGGGTNSIAISGRIMVKFNKKGEDKETIEVTETEQKDNLTFNDATLDKDHGTASNNAVLAVPTDGTEWYYTLPLSTVATAQPFTMQVSIDGDTKTATVPAAYMHWNPSTLYTYIFKITEAGKKIEFYDVLIDPWKYGGSQNVEWKNW